MKFNLKEGSSFEVQSSDSQDLLKVEESSGSASLCEITYAALKTLRDNGQLIPGMQYRITDYTCTTVTENTSSAGHQFDIIVVADSTTKLNEKARACLHAGDTYFANSKLEKWQLWYCLDNDTTRFEWADGPQPAYIDYNQFKFLRNSIYDSLGYGYGYKFDGFIEDYFNCFIFTDSLTNPTTFHMYRIFDPSEPTDMGDVSSSCTFHEATAGSGKGVIYRMIDEFGNDVPYDFKNILFTKSGKYTNAYTFTYTESSTLKDLSLVGLSGYRKLCYGNVIEAYIVNVDSTISKQRLNFNVFYSLSNTTTFYLNILRANCRDNTFISQCYGNTLENDCYSNTLNYNCNYLTFGHGCHSNTLGNSCQYSIFGDYCSSNTLGNYCTNNHFGKDYYSNTLGNSCTYNTFGDDCRNNTFGDYCQYNVFENSCQYNAFGDGCSNITFGNNCKYITFGDSSSATEYYQYNIIDNGCQYLYIVGNGTAAPSNYLQNVHIHLGVKGSSSSNMRTITVDRGLAYSTDIYANGSKEVVLDD